MRTHRSKSRRDSSAAIAGLLAKAGFLLREGMTSQGLRSKSCLRVRPGPRNDEPFDSRPHGGTYTLPSGDRRKRRGWCRSILSAVISPDPASDLMLHLLLGSVCLAFCAVPLARQKYQSVLESRRAYSVLFLCSCCESCRRRGGIAVSVLPG